MCLIGPACQTPRRSGVSVQLALIDAHFRKAWKPYVRRASKDSVLTCDFLDVIGGHLSHAPELHMPLLTGDELVLRSSGQPWRDARFFLGGSCFGVRDGAWGRHGWADEDETPDLSQHSKSYTTRHFKNWHFKNMGRLFMLVLLRELDTLDIPESIIILLLMFSLNPRGYNNMAPHFLFARCGSGQPFCRQCKNRRRERVSWESFRLNHMVLCAFGRKR